MKSKNKSYIIAETACHHEGDVNYLYRMIDEVAALKLEAIKFHIGLNPSSKKKKKHPLVKKAKQWAIAEGEWDKIIGYAAKKRLEVVTLCHDVEAMRFINNRARNKVRAIEIHANALNEWYLLQESLNFNKTVILGIGGSTMDEIAYAVDFLRRNQKYDILLMYGFQSYPTDYAHINLSKILKIKELFKAEVGYADHTAFDDPYNELISVTAAMLGVTVLEKHYTPKYGKQRTDYHAAVGKEQLAAIRKLMEVVLTVYGTGDIRMSEPELAYGNTGPMKKAIVAKRGIKKGEKLSLNNLWFKRTQQESFIKQNQFLQLLGLTATRDIEEDELIDFSKVEYKFKKTTAEDFTHVKK